jgi:hypothetical protein
MSFDERYSCFEYRVLSGRLSLRALNSILPELNELGRAGWELVATAYEGANEHTLLFKRALLTTAPDEGDG